MTRKLSKTEQWLREHPHDEPPPKSGGGALAWRKKRGLDPAGDALREKYNKLMTELRAAKAEADYPRID